MAQERLTYRVTVEVDGDERPDRVTLARAMTDAIYDKLGPVAVGAADATVVDVEWRR